MDGVKEFVRWHQGRCLSYGEGVALLGAGRDGPRAGGDHRGGGSGDGAREAARLGRGVRDRRARAPPRRAAARAPARGSRSGQTPTARTCSRAGGCSSSGSPRSSRWCWRSRTCSGPTAGCWTSSTTCSSGRPTTRSSCSRWDGPSCATPARRGSRSCWRRSARAASRLILEGLAPGLPEDLRGRDRSARRGNPAVRGRDDPDAAGSRPARAGGRPLRA